MGFYEEYKRKLKPAAEAVMAVKSGDWIDYTVAQGKPDLLDYALAARKGELKDVNCRGYLMFDPIQIVEQDPERESFTYHSWYMSGYERKYWAKGLISHIPMIFRNQASYYQRGYCKVDVCLITVAPMDENGYFSLHMASGSARPVIDAAETVIVEVNENLPNVGGIPSRLDAGINNCRIHISEVDIIVEGEHGPLTEIASAPASEEATKMANLVLPEIHDGAVLQIGVGGMPNLLGEYLAESDVKDLACHTELITDAYYKLYEKGKLTNSLKEINKGLSVFGLAAGSTELYSWLGDNPCVCGDGTSYINDPYVIGQMSNMIAINGCVSADLYGQVCSESAGTRQISGTGGQLDFITGAYMSPGGKAFTCMNSTYTDKNGVMHSNIRAKFTDGDIITDPRTQGYYIVTEQGMVNLTGRSTWERAELMISIAHPAFRDELIREAEKQGIWHPSNKR